MKFVKFFLFSFLIAVVFTSCEHYHANDIEAGTPTKADTVLPAKHHPMTPEQIQEYMAKLPRVYLR